MEYDQSDQISRDLASLRNSILLAAVVVAYPESSPESMARTLWDLVHIVTTPPKGE